MFDCAAHLDRLRETAPLVQSITNHVAMNLAANVLLAIGASPAMVHAKEEVEEFAALTDALCINIGTLSAPWIESMQLAARTAQHAGTPWVFDPVAVGATTFRQETAVRLLELKPTAIRGNASEIIALAAQVSADRSMNGVGRGVDSADTVEAAEQAAIALANQTDGVVAVTGPIDFVTDGRRQVRVANGHALMPKVTALGCAQSGVVAAFLAGAEDTFEATLAALASYAIAGEIAAQRAQGPGSFAVAFLDTLYQLDSQQLETYLRLETLDEL